MNDVAVVENSEAEEADPDEELVGAPDFGPLVGSFAIKVMHFAAIDEKSLL